MANTEPCIAELVQVGIRDEVTFGTDPAGAALYVGIVGAHDFPDPKKTWNKIPSRGSGRKPYTIASGRSTLRGSLPLTMINPKMLVYLMGQCSDDGATKTLTTTLASPYTAGGASVVVGVTTYANGDYIEVGVGANPEIRQVASGGASTTLTLDKPMRRDHASGATCNKVTGAITHTFVHRDGLLPSFTWEEGMVNSTNLIKVATGCRVDGAELSMEEGGQMLGKFDIAAQAATTGTLSTLTVPSTEPYSNEHASFNLYGSAFADVSKWSINYKNNIKEVYAMGSASPGNPRYLSAGMADITAKVTREFLDLTCWSYVYGAGAKFNAIFTLTRTAVSDLMVVTLYNCRLAEAKQSVPESQNIPENQDILAEYMTVVVTDTTYYW